MKRIIRYVVLFVLVFVVAWIVSMLVSGITLSPDTTGGVLLLVLLGAAAFLVVWRVPDVQIQDLVNAPNSELDRQKTIITARNEVRKTTAQIVGGGP